MRRLIMVLAAAALGLAGCREKRATEQQAMPGMEGMAGMQGMTMKSDSLMPMMRAHLDSLARTPAQFAIGMLAAHDGMASEMLDAMGADMRMMRMAPDTAWNALTDSIRRDLADLPGLSGRSLEVRVRTHVERMRRLLDMHERMMPMHR